MNKSTIWIGLKWNFTSQSLKSYMKRREFWFLTIMRSIHSFAPLCFVSQTTSLPVLPPKEVWIFEILELAWVHVRFCGSWWSDRQLDLRLSGKGADCSKELYENESSNLGLLHNEVFKVEANGLLLSVRGYSDYFPNNSRLRRINRLVLSFQGG